MATTRTIRKEKHQRVVFLGPPILVMREDDRFWLEDTTQQPLGCAVDVLSLQEDEQCSGIEQMSDSLAYRILSDWTQNPFDDQADIDNVLGLCLERASRMYCEEKTTNGSSIQEEISSTQHDKEQDVNQAPEKELFESDIDWWCLSDDTSSRLLVSSLTRLRRCLMPVILCFPKNNSAVQGNGESCRIHRQNLSLVDCLLSTNYSAYVLKLLCAYKSLLIEYGGTSENRGPIEEAVSLIIEALRRHQLKQYELNNLIASGQIHDDALPLTTNASFTAAGDKRRRLSNPSNDSNGYPLISSAMMITEKSHDHAELEASRKVPLKLLRPDHSSMTNSELLQLDIQHTKRGLVHETLFPEKQQLDTAPVNIRNEVVVITSEDMTETCFLEEKLFMDTVNRSIPRTFYQHSRPFLAKSVLTRNHLDDLRRIFFDDESGSLRPSIRKDVFVEADNHNYIVFENQAGGGAGDCRWQVPIAMHQTSCDGGNINNETRHRVEQILISAGQLDPRYEHAVDINLLVGGTQTQALHHDHAREFTEWYQRADGNPDDAIMGWESERASYNLEMASAYAPSGQIYALSTKLSPPSVQLGVQETNIMSATGSLLDNNSSEAPEFCSILNGRDGESFLVDRREGESVVVIESPVGFVFTGDFPHAGVRNVKVGCDADQSMVSLFKKIDLCRSECKPNSFGHESLNIMCEHSQLNELCRLYVSTELNHSRIRIPRNRIGYTACASNP